MIRLSGITGLAAATWLMMTIGAASAVAATEEPGASSGRSLPPLSGPPVDVATRDPKPPRDVDVPMQRPVSPSTTTFLPTPPQRFSLTPPASPPVTTAALPLPPTPRPARAGAAIASSAPIAAPTVTPRPFVRPPPTATITPMLCRGEAVYSVMVDGRPQLTRARICQQPDGSWTVTQ